MATRDLDRRAFLKLTALAALGPGAAGPLADPRVTTAHRTPADHTLRIRDTPIELAPGHSVSTPTYNGQFPGPLLRLAVGRPVIIDVYNETETPEIIHWHGQDSRTQVASEIETTPARIPAHGQRRLEFTPTHPGLSFYHSAGMAAANLRVGLYGGLSGSLLVSPRGAPERDADREVVLVLKEFEPRLRRTPQGFEVGYELFTINGRMLGHGEPISVNAGQRVLFHVLNASATQIRQISLSQHTFQVVALDGSAVPVPGPVSVLRLGPAERVSATVDMNRPGVWVLGELCDSDRCNGLGIVIEYAGRGGEPQWTRPTGCDWDYLRFGRHVGDVPDATADVVFAMRSGVNRGFKQWTVNGSSFSASGGNPILRARPGGRYRLRMRNVSDEVCPVYLQGHRLRLTRIGETPTGGIIKDVVVLGSQQSVEADFVANNPGPTLLQSTRQFQRDFGLMARIEYV
jgi:FtsP/CotA-like multicopper oxidase with cupredoxin domain